MLLQALHQLAKDEQLVGAIDYFWRNVAWFVELRRDGSIKEFTDNRVDLNEGRKDKKGKPLPPKMVGRPVYCPMQFYRSGGKAAPHFMVDTARYVFGIDDKIAASRRVMLSAMFRARVAQCASDTGNSKVQSTVTSLECYAPPNGPPLPHDVEPGDMFAFRVGGEFVHQTADVMRWWKMKQAEQDIGDGSYQCMVTGKTFHKVTKFPKTGGIPGTKQDIKIVSFAENAYESHGWDANENAPISREAGLLIGAALTRLLSKAPLAADGTALSVRHIHIPGDTAVCYWSHDPSELETYILDNLWRLVLGRPACDEDESPFAAEVQRIWDGEEIDIPDPAIVYVLGISGGLGRATVRSWQETTLPEMLKNLTQHFADMKIGRSARSEKEPVIPFYRLIESLTTGEGSNPTVPVSLEMSFLRAVINGTRYPDAIPGLALRRMRAEIGKAKKDDNVWMKRARMDARMALVKAHMNRRARLDTTNPSSMPLIGPDMDPTITNVGYCLGVMLALMERIQQAAAGKPLNSTIIDRFFGAASTAPQGTFIRLLRMTKHHVSKAKRGEKLNRIMAIRCERMLVAVQTKISPADGGIPARLDTEGQSLFALGYHQMQHWLYMPKAARAAWEERYADTADPAFIWPRREEESEDADAGTATEPAAA
jgi:CRISPR-associated protein Csd1